MVLPLHLNPWTLSQSSEIFKTIMLNCRTYSNNAIVTKILATKMYCLCSWPNSEKHTLRITWLSWQQWRMMEAYQMWQSGILGYNLRVWKCRLNFFNESLHATTLRYLVLYPWEKYYNTSTVENSIKYKETQVSGTLWQIYALLSIYTSGFALT